MSNNNQERERENFFVFFPQILMLCVIIMFMVKGYFLFRDTAPKVEMSDVVTLQIGMTKEEVETILGKDGELSITEAMDSEREYNLIYKVKGTNNRLYLDFNEDLTLERINTL